MCQLKSRSIISDADCERRTKLAKKWIDTKLLSLNTSKSNYITFYFPLMSIPSDIVIEIGKEHTNRSNYIKFLGLLLDENLNWKFHLSELSKKLAKTCRILFKIRDLLPTSTLINVENSLFISVLQYRIIMWGQTSVSYMEPIFKLKKL